MAPLPADAPTLGEEEEPPIPVCPGCGGSSFARTERGTYSEEHVIDAQTLEETWENQDQQVEKADGWACWRCNTYNVELDEEITTWYIENL